MVVTGLAKFPPKLKLLPEMLIFSPLIEIKQADGSIWHSSSQAQDDASRTDTGFSIMFILDVR